jgi:hypothetical protein
VNWPRALGADVPAAVTTVTYSVPLPGGLSAVIWVLETTFMSVAGSLPNSTSLTALKQRPVMTTGVCKNMPPLFGEMPVTTGRHLCGPEGTGDGSEEVLVELAHARPVTASTTADMTVRAARADCRAGDVPA